MLPYRDLTRKVGPIDGCTRNDHFQLTVAKAFAMQCVRILKTNMQLAYFLESLVNVRWMS